MEIHEVIWFDKSKILFIGNDGIQYIGVHAENNVGIQELRYRELKMIPAKQCEDIFHNS